MKPAAYFIGIGGIGMSALARYYHAKGAAVSGYDRTATPLTQALQDEGMTVVFQDTVAALPLSLAELPQVDLDVIYTPAVPDNHPQLQWFRDQGYTVRKRAAALAEIVNTGTGLAVAGTHGKTTTSSMLAYLLKASGTGCNAFLGGIASNYGTNTLTDPGSDLMVVEADEYDRSFLTLHPTRAALTSMDPDHLDIYQDPDHMDRGFIAFLRQVNHTLVHEDLHDRLVELGYSAQQTYGEGHTATYRATDIRITDGHQVFDLHTPAGRVSCLKLAMPGRHNLHNAVAAIALALESGVPAERIQQVLPGFRGVKRRFEKILERPVVVIDDYAHHPTELNAAIDAAREMYPGKTLHGIFQPHLFTRTRDFADGFGKSLGKLDKAYLLPIYPAREEPLPGVDSQWLLDKITNTPAQVVQKTDFLACLRDDLPDVLLILGAGDIDQLVAPVKQALQS